MQTEIVMIDYARPLAERAKMRKRVGPYRWTPRDAKKRHDVGFYMNRRGDGVDRAGSTFDLRILDANDRLPSYSRMQGITGYYCDESGDETLAPIIARLPRGRGFLAGWTMGAGMCAGLETHIYFDAETAAYDAHTIAERVAEDMRTWEVERTDEEA